MMSGSLLEHLDAARGPGPADPWNPVVVERLTISSTDVDFAAPSL